VCNKVKDKNIEEIVREIIAQQLRINPGEISNSSLLVEELGADSLDMVELMVKFVQEFDIDIDDESIRSVRTFGDIVNALKKEILKKKG